MNVSKQVAGREDDLSAPGGPVLPEVREHPFDAPETELRILRREPVCLAINVEPVIASRPGEVHRKKTDLTCDGARTTIQTRSPRSAVRHLRDDGCRRQGDRVVAKRDHRTVGKNSCNDGHGENGRWPCGQLLAPAFRVQLRVVLLWPTRWSGVTNAYRYRRLRRDGPYVLQPPRKGSSAACAGFGGSGM